MRVVNRRIFKSVENTSQNLVFEKGSRCRGVYLHPENGMWASGWWKIYARSDEVPFFPIKSEEKWALFVSLSLLELECGISVRSADSAGYFGVFSQSSFNEARSLVIFMFWWQAVFYADFSVSVHIWKREMPFSLLWLQCCIWKYSRSPSSIPQHRVPINYRKIAKIYVSLTLCEKGSNF